MLLQSIHGRTDKQLGISKMMQEVRHNFYFPSITTHVRNWVREFEVCIQNKRINSTRITAELIRIPEWDLGPECCMQIHL